LKTDNDNDEFLKISESFLSHFIGLSDPNAWFVRYRYTRQELEKLYS